MISMWAHGGELVLDIRGRSSGDGGLGRRRDDRGILTELDLSRLSGPGGR